MAAPPSCCRGRTCVGGSAPELIAFTRNNPDGQVERNTMCRTCWDRATRDARVDIACAKCRRRMWDTWAWLDPRSDTAMCAECAPFDAIKKRLPLRIRNAVDGCPANPFTILDTREQYYSDLFADDDDGDDDDDAGELGNKVRARITIAIRELFNDDDDAAA